MRKMKLASLAGVIVAIALVGAESVGASANAPLRFGAKLTTSSQPSNAEGGRSCDENGGIPSGGNCTWVSVEAYQNAGRERAPRTGTIRRVRLVSCVAGSFRLQFAAVRLGREQAKVVRNGPVIRYQADPRQVDADEDTFCGGEEADDFIIQTFPVSVHVNKGEYIAIRAKSTGTLYCSGGSGVLLFNPPLGPRGGYRGASDSTSCNLLVQLQYG